MTVRIRPVVVALAAAVVLIIRLSKETWIAIPIVAGVGVFLLARGNHVGRRPTVAALVFVGSIAFVAFGTVIALLSTLARHLAGLVLASGVTAITLGAIGLVVSAVYLRRAMRPPEPAPGPTNQPVSSP